MIILVEVRNQILGDQVFGAWPVDQIESIHNVVARDLARQVAVDGVPRFSGMWHISVANDEVALRK